MVCQVVLMARREVACFGSPCIDFRTGGIMAIDVKLTDREVVIVLTLCELLGKPATMRDAELACLHSVRTVNRETESIDELTEED